MHIKTKMQKLLAWVVCNLGVFCFFFCLFRYINVVRVAFSKNRIMFGQIGNIYTSGI